MSVQFGIHKQRFFFQSTTERIHIEKRYGPRRQENSDDEEYSVQINRRKSFILFFPFLLYQQILTIPIFQIQPILVLQLTICPIQVLLQDMFLYLALIQKIHQKFEFNLLQLIRETLQAKPGKTKKKWVRYLVNIIRVFQNLNKICKIGILAYDL